jgi:hypothetical protein
MPNYHQAGITLRFSVGLSMATPSTDRTATRIPRTPRAQSAVWSRVFNYAITQRTSLPTWSLPNHTNVSQALSAAQYGPPVNTTFSLGRYVEDFDWVSGVGDLDQYNGRFAITPDFPNGTYAYFVTIDASGNPAFPYIVAGQYYGTTGSGFSATGASSAATYFKSGTYSTGPSTPEMTSWVTRHSTQYAQVVSGYDPSAGPSTTWPGTNSLGAQTMGAVITPALAEPHSIQQLHRIRNLERNGRIYDGPVVLRRHDRRRLSEFPEC